MDFLRKNVNKHINYGGGSPFSASYVSGTGTTIIKDTEVINVKNYGAIGNGITDDTAAIQNAINSAYELNKMVYFPAGTYIVTESIFLYDGIHIKGDGIYNTIIRTPFAKTAEAKAYVTRDANKEYCTLMKSNNIEIPDFDYLVGHNRFYIGNGVVGYYDADRDTNTHHKLYYPKPDDADEEEKALWMKWNAERKRVIKQGRWIGKTGREGYGGAVFKSSQKPNLRYEDYIDSDQFPYGTIHTGIRNVKIQDLQINTNSSDRGKDSAIDFQYKADTIPPQIRETYDSSVLNVHLENLYLFGLGKSGYRGTRCVDHTFIGVYVRQAAEQGFYIDGVTSCFFTGCYANSCLEGGYVLRGVNYSSLNSCAADSCSIGYNLYNCNGVSLNGCGSEATRYQKAGEDVEAEDPYKGRGFSIRNSNGISLVSCYTMTSHPKVYSDEAIDITDEEQDPNWLKSRHVFVSESKNVQISYCYFKCFQRVRSTPFRDADNQKCSWFGGTYRPTEYGSRYWQVQNYLVGAQFEIRGESSSVHLIAGESKDDLVKTSEIRTGNLDLLDLGLVPNPLENYGFSTAGKTMSGDDGNGGWFCIRKQGEDIYDEDGIYVETIYHDIIEHVTFENFEFVFPINAKKLYGLREKFWEWRNSLILVRKLDDTSLLNENKYGRKYRSKYRGYVSALADREQTGTIINWANVNPITLNQFKIDIVDDYSDTTLIDGDKSLFSYGKFSWQQLNTPVAYEPSVYSPIPCYIRGKAEGSRIVINSNSIDGYSSDVNKAAVTIVGNKYIPASTEEGDEREEIIPSATLALLSRRKQDDLQDKEKVMFITNSDGKDFLSIFERNDSNKAISIKEKELISTNPNDYNYIRRVASTATNEQLANTLNDILDRLTNHGFIDLPSEDGEILFNNVSVSSSDSSSAVVSFHINNTGSDIVYRAGVVYSNSNQMPTYSDNRATATLSTDDTYEATLTYGNNNKRYVRFYVETAENGGAANRLFCNEVYVLYYSQNDSRGKIVNIDDYVEEIPVEEPTEGELNFSVPTIVTVANKGDAVIYFEITNTTTDPHYGVGVAYSTSNQNPTRSNGYVNATEVDTDNYNAAIPLGNNNFKYFRMFCNTADGESGRIYSDSYSVDGNGIITRIE